MAKLDIRKLKAIQKSLKAASETTVEIGIFEDAVYEEGRNAGMHVAEVAALNNSGTRDIPRRPFADDTFEKKANVLAIQKHIAKAAASLFSGKNPTSPLSALGAAIRDIMKREVEDYPGHNSAATIAFKGFDDPLFETGKLLESIQFKLKSKFRPA